MNITNSSTTWTKNMYICKNLNIPFLLIILLFCIGPSIITANAAKKKKVKTYSVTGKINGHDYVDLELPSGTKWAVYDIGASTATGSNADYFAWGDIAYVKNMDTSYDWSHYKYCYGSWNTMTKYCLSASYGTVDGKKELELEDDAAHVRWGASWRMPTKEQFEELINPANCICEEAKLFGYTGYLITSVRNGNCLFMAGGHWTRTVDKASCYAYKGSGYSVSKYNRHVTFRIRPVSK